MILITLNEAWYLGSLIEVEVSPLSSGDNRWMVKKYHVTQTSQRNRLAALRTDQVLGPLSD